MSQAHDRYPEFSVVSGVFKFALRSLIFFLCNKESHFVFTIVILAKLIKTE